MVDTAEREGSGDPPGPASHRPRADWGDRVRLLLRGIGQTLITAGVVVLLFVVYEVYVTNLVAGREQAKVRTALTRQWERVQGDDPLLPLPNGVAPTLPDGQGIAYLYIPRLGRDYGWAVVEGTSSTDLEKGPGHYASTALPGAIGNFGVAGHRVGKGEPFLNLDKLRAGDAVIVQTRSTWYVYRVKGTDAGRIDSTDADGVPGREIVAPSDGAVLDPVPNDPDRRPTEALMTMTTCHPKFTATQRMVVHAALVSTVKAQGVAMPAAITALYDRVSA